jgi:hypothetical protein
MLGIQSETNGMPDDVASDLSGSFTIDCISVLVLETYPCLHDLII